MQATGGWVTRPQRAGQNPGGKNFETGVKGSFQGCDQPADETILAHNPAVTGGAALARPKPSLCSISTRPAWRFKATTGGVLYG